MIRKVAFNTPYREGLSPAVSKPRKVKSEVHLRIDKPNTRDVSLIGRVFPRARGRVLAVSGGRFIRLAPLQALEIDNPQ